MDSIINFIEIPETPSNEVEKTIEHSVMDSEQANLDLQFPLSAMMNSIHPPMTMVFCHDSKGFKLPLEIVPPMGVALTYIS